MMQKTTIQKTITDDKLFKILNRVSSKQNKKNYEQDKKTFKLIAKNFDSRNDGYIK